MERKVTTFGDMMTPDGYNCGEVASALQKCVRRGDEDGALFWATELDRAGFGEYVWKRLRIMASEDVGLGDPMVCVQVRALYDNWRDQKAKRDERHGPERLFLVHAVLVLARCLKSRLVDHALILHYEGPRPKRPIPDVAFDKHTKRGRMMGRGVAHFFDEGAKLENAAPLDDPYRDQAKVIRSGPPRADAPMEQGSLL